jgi:hypothetical protein
MRERGYTVGNIDCTIIAQRPKMSPHKEAIRDNLCSLLDAHPRWAGLRGLACGAGMRQQWLQALGAGHVPGLGWHPRVLL